jgi:restriction system protein
MTRRKKSSTFEELIDIVAMLPCWAGVVLAVVAYLVLHQVAAQPLVTTIQSGQSGSIATQTIWKGLATGGQYLLPLICLAGAGMSAWRRRERAALVQNVVKSDSADALNGMSWQQFEQLVGEAFRLQGYTVAETGGGGADGGVDLALTKGGEKFLVQCKQWRAFKVSVEVVRELYGVMAAQGAAGGFVVTSGRFTEEATAFASGRNVQLIDGPKLHGMIQQAQAVRQSSGAAQPVRSAPRPSSPPACPKCSKPMVKRTARCGANAGCEFWGCTGYPACKGTSPVG